MQRMAEFAVITVWGARGPAHQDRHRSMAPCMVTTSKESPSSSARGLEFTADPSLHRVAVCRGPSRPPRSSACAACARLRRGKARSGRIGVGRASAAILVCGTLPADCPASVAGGLPRPALAHRRAAGWEPPCVIPGTGRGRREETRSPEHSLRLTHAAQPTALWGAGAHERFDDQPGAATRLDCHFAGRPELRSRGLPARHAGVLPRGRPDPQPEGPQRVGEEDAPAPLAGFAAQLRAPPLLAPGAAARARRAPSPAALRRGEPGVPLLSAFAIEAVAAWHLATAAGSD